MSVRAWGVGCVLGLVAVMAADKPDRFEPSGDATIKAKAGPSDLVVTTTTRLAGAVHSVTWNGKEFIDSTDHGRQLQSAATFGTGEWKDYAPETFNPTEAGSRRDHIGPKSTSQLLELEATGDALRTLVRPAFWLAPGEKDETGKPARNVGKLSDHRIAKRVKVGYKNFPQVLDYKVTFTVPAGEGHTLAQFEAVTGYMPWEFAKFRTLDVKTGKLGDLTDGPGEQGLPVVLSTADDQFAMGVWSPDQPSKGYEHAGYGRFRFAAAKVVKWNCVFRYRDDAGIKPGEYAFRAFVAVGTLADVRDTLVGVAKAFGGK